MAKKRKLPKKAIKEEQKSSFIRANRKEARILGLVSEEIESNTSVLKMSPYVALKYFKSDWQCFYDWEQQELKEFSAFLDNLKRHTWS